MSADETAGAVYRNVTSGYNPIAGDWFARRYRTWRGRIGTHWCEECETAKMVVEVMRATFPPADIIREYCGVHHFHTDSWTRIRGSNISARSSANGKGVYVREDDSEE